MTTLPQNFLDQLSTNLSQVQVDAFILSMDEKPTTSIRFSTHKTIDQMGDSIVPWCPLGRYLDIRPKFIFDPLFHAGAYYVQEASSMLVWQALEQILKLEDSPTILDLCAAPGGKSTLIANFLKGSGTLISNEVIKNRAYTLKQNIAKEGFTNVVVTNNDPRDFGKLSPMFDMIVVDAPCSGEGMFRKDPNAIQEWSLDNVALCCGRQKRIIADVVSTLKPGGFIVYSTCTYNDQENIDNVNWLRNEFDMQSISLDIDKSWGITPISNNKAIGYQCYPHLTRGEGLFISVLQKKQGENNHHYAPKDTTYITPSKKQYLEIDTWVDPKSDVEIYLDKVNNVHAMSPITSTIAKQISPFCRIIASGVTVGSFNKDIIIPDHSLALSTILHSSIPRYELNHREALLFLKKELQEINSDKRSWHLATYQNLGIGWLKNLGNRINNYLPNELRILKRLE
jgi:16S rRNA C967 or C1407 C5-methylase (RsmB/RsmF family)/NOL1/NOP2/fmu family ribosome biogenesis protein